MASRSCGMAPGRSRKPVRPACCQSSSRSASCGRGADEDGGVAGVLAAGQVVEASLAVGRGGDAFVEEDDEVAEDVHGLVGPTGGRLRGADLVDDRAAWSASRGVTKPTSADAADELVRHALVAERGDERLALRRPRRDRRALDAEVLALEVDVVQLVAVDEPAGGDVADLRVVLPAVPEPPQHLDVVGGLVEQFGDELLDDRVVAVLDADRAETCGGRSARPRRGGRRPGPARRPGRC